MARACCGGIPNPCRSVDSRAIKTESRLCSTRPTLTGPSLPSPTPPRIRLPPIRGDFNGDGHFTASDITAMINALGDLSSYQIKRAFTNPDMQYLADFNGDGVITNADLQGMLDALLAGQGSTDSVPEPATGWLLGVAAAAVFIRSRRKCMIEPQLRR